MTASVVTNLQILKPSRKAPMAGDVFAFRPKGRGYFFGRVVRTDAKMQYMADSILLYLFATESATPQPPERLLVGDLLVPPLMTNRLPWSKGYFETVANRAFTPGERLPVHCFLDPSFKKYSRYWDDSERELAEKLEPCGVYALHSFRTIDDEVSEALGIPLVPD